MGQRKMLARKGFDGSESYVPAGNLALSVREVERRIYRAMKTLRAMPDRDRRLFNFQNSWPPYVRDFMDAYESVHELAAKFKPTPADVSDYLTALSWTRILEKREWKLLWWRSFDLSFKHIGIRIGRSDETARRRYKDAVLKAWSYSAHTQDGRGGRKGRR